MRISLAGFKELINVDTAREKLLAEVTINPQQEHVGINEALGRIACEDIEAPYDYPPFNRSAVDGYAVKHEDILSASENNPTPLRIVGEVEAGCELELPILRSGEAVIVYTGAPLPEGSDVVVPFENTARERNMVYVMKNLPKYKNVSYKGEDFRKGEIIVSKGIMLRPWHIAALAQAGFKEINVCERLKIGIINSGNELNESIHRSQGRIPNSTGPLIAAYVKELGLEPLLMGIVPDDKELIKSSVREALSKANLVVITGGTSIGKRDLVPEALKEISGSELIFHGVNLRPGRTAGAFVANGKPILMLSGLPVACLVGLENFLKPLIKKALSLKLPPTSVVRAKLARRLANVVGFRSYFRVVVYWENDELLVEPLRLTGSGILSTLLKGNGIIEVKEDLEGFEAGDLVDVRLISEPYPEKPSFLTW